MALPEGAVVIKDAVERPFITLRNLYITFSKLAIEDLEYTPYVHMLVVPDKPLVIFQACESDSAAIPFYREPKEGKQLLVRITGKKNAQRLMGIAGLKDCGHGLRFYGEYLPEDRAIVFDMSQSFPTK